MEMKSPPPCPSTVTVRRNPLRKVRATPSSAIPLREPLSSPSLSRDIFSTELPQNPNITTNNNKITDPSPSIQSEHLKVYLRIRPLAVQKSTKNVPDSKNAWPKNPKIRANIRPKTKKSGEICVQVNEDLRSVTVSAPQALQDTKRIKSEVYEGFSRVFASEASQNDVYEEMVKPLVEDFLKGTSGMLAAMGPSGSGKTHTVFGCAREPGMVPLALCRIFGENEGNGNQLSRVFYLSMFEISSEKGKAERMIDLLHDGGDMCMQYSVLKGLQETVVRDAQQAESLIAHGMLKRSTAMTNSNSQSSRSQCIINIRSGSKKSDEEVDGKASSPMLTIVDLAGAEREKKTGNQGSRLLESNFINNTSMVFGLCLRSLLEHQKNRNKPLQKHYKNSLLTRYMQDYLEGRKRMMLILTVKPGVEDYLDTSFLLRQASPFTKIKFKNQEEPIYPTCNKRPNQALPRAEQLKKMKFSDSESSSIDDRNTDGDLQFTMQEVAGKVVNDGLIQNIEDFNDENFNEILHVLSDEFVGMGIQQKPSLNGDCTKHKAEKDRGYQIMQGFSKALWTVLKQYKERLEGVEMENCQLRESLTNEKTRSLDLENELTNEKIRLFDLQNELKKLKSQCTCSIKASADVLPVSSHDACSNLSHCQTADFQEVRSKVSSYSLKEFEQTNNEKITDPSVRDPIVIFASCSDRVNEHYPQQPEGLSERSEDAQDVKGFKDITAVDFCSKIQELSITTDYAPDFNCFDDTVILDLSSINEEISQLTAAHLHPSHNSEQDAVNIVEDAKTLEIESECVSNLSCRDTSLECKISSTFQNCEDLHDAKGEPNQDDEDLNIVGDEKKLDLEDECVSNGSCVATSPECESANSSQNYESKGEPTQDYEGINTVGGSQALEVKSDSANGLCLVTSLECEDVNTTQHNLKDFNCFEDTGILDLSSINEKISQLMAAHPHPSHNSEQDAVNIVEDAKTLEVESECISNLSCLDTSLEYKIPNTFQNCEDLHDAKGEKNQDYEDLNIVGDAKKLDLKGECVSNGSCVATSPECESANSSQNYESKGEPTQDYEGINIVGGAQALEVKSDCANVSCLVTSLECEDANTTQHNLKDPKGEPTQLDNAITDSSPNPSGCLEVESCTVLSSSEPPQKYDILLNVDEKELNHEEGKLDQQVKVLPEEGLDVKSMSKFVPTLAPIGNFQPTKKPKRRLLPASSVLLKDMTLLDIKDENDRPKGGKGGKRVPIDDEKNRTKGNLSLHNLLTSKLDR